MSQISNETVTLVPLFPDGHIPLIYDIEPGDREVDPSAAVIDQSRLISNTVSSSSGENKPDQVAAEQPSNVEQVPTVKRRLGQFATRLYLSPVTGIRKITESKHRLDGFVNAEDHGKRNKILVGAAAALVVAGVVGGTALGFDVAHHFSEAHRHAAEHITGSTPRHAELRPIKAALPKQAIKSEKNLKLSQTLPAIEHMLHALSAVKHVQKPHKTITHRQPTPAFFVEKLQPGGDNPWHETAKFLIKSGIKHPTQSQIYYKWKEVIKENGGGKFLSKCRHLAIGFKLRIPRK